MAHFSALRSLLRTVAFENVLSSSRGVPQVCYSAEDVRVGFLSGSTGCRLETFGNLQNGHSMPPSGCQFVRLEKLHVGFLNLFLRASGLQIGFPNRSTGRLFVPMRPNGCRFVSSETLQNVFLN